jgi:hypothetical protein
MKQYDISIIDLTSAILQVRSYFENRGVKIRVRKKKSQSHFTTGHHLPILINDTRGGPSHAACLRDRKRLSGSTAGDTA